MRCLQITSGWLSTVFLDDLRTELGRQMRWSLAASQELAGAPSAFCIVQAAFSPPCPDHQIRLHTHYLSPYNEEMKHNRKSALTSNLLLAGRQWRKLCEAALAKHDISEARAAALVWVHRLGGGVRQVTLANHIGIDGTSLVRLLDQLSAADLVVRRDDPSDRRANTIWLTAEGERLAGRIERILTELRDHVLRDVSPAEVAAALKVLDAINRASGAEQYEPQRPETVE
jgi:MarR family transcriptional regulator for hemolysin